MRNVQQIINSLLLRDPVLDVTINYLDEEKRQLSTTFYKVTFAEYERLFQRIIVLSDKIDILNVSYNISRDY